MQGDEREEIQVVQDIMASDVACVSPKTLLPEAARLMLDQDVGMLPVVDENNVLIGVLTDRDIAVRGVAEDQDVSQMPVESCMTKEDLVVATPEMDLEEAEDLMAEHQVRRLPVVAEDNAVIGVVTLTDIVQHLDELEGEEVQTVAEVLEDITIPGGEHSQKHAA